MQASQETPEELRHAFGHLPSGVVAVCALVGGRPVGMAASSFVPVSLKPPLVSFCAARTSRTWEALRQVPSLGVSVLAEDHTTLCRALASSAEDRFADVRWQAGESGAVFLPGTVLWLECALDSEVEAGDHVIAVLRLRGTALFPQVRPLVFHQGHFERLGSSQPPARTHASA
jgi:flavin reductase (DIM6/NTAB) family NADH-FMN oxidoreductase RutF